MKTVYVKINPETLAGLPRGRVNKNHLDATSERDIVLQMAKDDAEAMQDAAKFTRRVRRRLGLSQLEFSQRIDVSLETIRNWEQSIGLTPPAIDLPQPVMPGLTLWRNM